MAADTREAILARLETVFVTLAGAGHVFRNTTTVPETALPAIQFFDADEGTDESAYGRGRSAAGPVVVGMTPEIYVSLATEQETVGTDINAWRAKVIKAVMTDPELQALCHNGDIRYAGCATALARGRDMVGECGLAFTFNYVLRPERL